MTGVSSTPVAPGARVNCVSLQRCRFSSFDVSLFHAIKKMHSAFSLPWKIFMRINEMVLMKHLGEKQHTDHWHLGNVTVSCCEIEASVKPPSTNMLFFSLCLH